MQSELAVRIEKMEETRGSELASMGGMLQQLKEMKQAESDYLSARMAEQQAQADASLQAVTAELAKAKGT
eukprot:CAMPEP_0198208388 /NCGR_PEP_ID=MMETSP1445-20131203/11761_1 /TAXON_ID=36898 /ORGANISM="Pyramimonas sp., Strain CCMP2087" /LENGTH=69 /DNA_ID=CAMNT_0043881771 /DNA_START=82 /DNA_END=287 /DNA_ORIENTATION=+